MNRNLDFIFRRRSVRHYTGKPLPKDAIQALMQAAMAAPSAAAKDPWHFVIVEDKNALEKIAMGLPNGRMLAEAEAGIVVCGDPADAHHQKLSFLLQDCSAAIQNILLAASALGLGACWLGVHPNEDRAEHLRATLGIPGSFLPVGVVSVGMPGDNPAPRTRYSEAKVHKEKW